MGLWIRHSASLTYQYQYHEGNILPRFLFIGLCILGTASAQVGDTAGLEKCQRACKRHASALEPALPPEAQGSLACDRSCFCHYMGIGCCWFNKYYGYNKYKCP